MQPLGLSGEMESIQKRRIVSITLSRLTRSLSAENAKRKERTMETRLNAQQASPAAYAAMIGLETFVRKASKLDPSLVELVKVSLTDQRMCLLY
jgi:hypothetical protein